MCYNCILNWVIGLAIRFLLHQWLHLHHQIRPPCHQIQPPRLPQMYRCRPAWLHVGEGEKWRILMKSVLIIDIESYWILVFKTILSEGKCGVPEV